MAREKCRVNLLAKLPTFLSRLGKRERRWRSTRSRRDLMRFLHLAFDLHTALRKADLASRGARRIAELAGRRWQPKQHLFRAIIDAVSRANRRTKSRWVRALRFAWLERQQYDGLDSCLRDNGGIAGCADRWATLRAGERSPPGYVRVGGEHRVPKIPFLVRVELLSPNGYFMGEKLR